MLSTLVDTQTLQDHLADSNWIIFDCRFELSDASWGENLYKQGHIPGAIYAHLDRDLSGVKTASTGRHPLPVIEEFVSRLEAWGVSNQKQVVVYDQAGGAFASRLWWMLRYLGHDGIAILDGGYAKWTIEKRPFTTDRPFLKPARFTPALRPDMLVSSDEVFGKVNDPAVKLLDSRAPIRYRGEQEPIDPVAGHIPGAINRFHGENLTPEGTFLSESVLRTQLTQLLGSTPADRTIVYCGSGVTSCHNILAMELAGLGLPRLYAGSWSEWIHDPSRPIATGNS